MTTLGLKNVNMLSKEQYDTIAEPATDELYAISGSGFGFPSNRYDDLELGASGTNYIAPANGWFTFRFTATAAGAWIYGEIFETRLTKQQSAYAASYQIGTTFPVKKGENLVLMYSNINTTPLVFKFIYAEGE